MNADLEALAHDYWEGVLRRNPVLATFYSDYRWNDRLPQIDASARQDEEHELRSVLQRLEPIVANAEALDAEDRITADMLRLAVQAGLDALRLRLDELSVDQMDGPQVWLLELTNWHPLDTREHVEQLIARYEAFGTFMDQYLETLQDGIKDSRTAPTIAAERVQAQLTALLQRPIHEWPLPHRPNPIPPSQTTSEAPSSTRSNPRTSA
jgi:uncharacterized protein (DUF885 family)